MFEVKEEVFSLGKAYRVKDWLALSLLARPFRSPTGVHLLCEIVSVFSLVASSGGTILFFAFRPYKLHRVLARCPPKPYFILYHKKGKNYNYFCWAGKKIFISNIGGGKPEGEIARLPR